MHQFAWYDNAVGRDWIPLVAPILNMVWSALTISFGRTGPTRQREHDVMTSGHSNARTRRDAPWSAYVRRASRTEYCTMSTPLLIDIQDYSLPATTAWLNQSKSDCNNIYDWHLESHYSEIAQLRLCRIAIPLPREGKLEKSCDRTMILLDICSPSRSHYSQWWWGARRQADQQTQCNGSGRTISNIWPKDGTIYARSPVGVSIGDHSTRALAKKTKLAKKTIFSHCLASFTDGDEDKVVARSAMEPD